MSEYKLWLGDCLEFMRTLDAGSVDAVITDPPYDKRTHLGAVTERETIPQGGIGHITLGVIFKPIEDRETLVFEFLRISKSWSIAFCTLEDIGAWRDQAWKYCAWVRSGIWDRINPSPQFSGDRPSQACEGLSIMHNPSKRKQWNGGGHSAIWRVSVEFGMKEHPTQKPLKLMHELIADFTNPHDTVFDPFMGSGTTGVACMQLGRNFIGCEIDPNYYAIAERRIREAAMQPPLFSVEAEQEQHEQAEMF